MNAHVLSSQPNALLELCMMRIWIVICLRDRIDLVIEDQSGCSSSCNDLDIDMHFAPHEQRHALHVSVCTCKDLCKTPEHSVVMMMPQHALHALRHQINTWMTDCLQQQLQHPPTLLPSVHCCHIATPAEAPSHVHQLHC